MGGSGFRARSVRRSPQFDNHASQIQPDARRLDEQLRGVEWAVATNAEALPEIPGTRLRLIKTDPFPDAPAVRVFFTVDDDDCCTLQFIEEIEELAEEEDFSE